MIANYKSRICVLCGKEYKPNNSNAKHCSPECMAESCRIRARKYYYEKRKHPCIICGQSCKASICQSCSSVHRYYDKHGGYVYLRIPNYPSAQKNGTILEHRYVMEKFLGRQLTRDEIIHHLNGIRNDNRIENLAIVGKHSHPSKSYIKSLQKRVRKLEAQLSQQRF